MWRVCWNITGTILATSGDDGCVKLWKANYMDNWKCVSTLMADGQVTNPVTAALGKAGMAAIVEVTLVLYALVRSIWLEGCWGKRNNEDLGGKMMEKIV